MLVDMDYIVGKMAVTYVSTDLLGLQENTYA